MRKIISILVALGLVLAFSAVAMPATAATCTATVTLSPATACAGAVTTYNISFVAPATLLAGNDLLSVDFGAGTSLASVLKTDVLVAGGGSPSSITVSGTHIEFPVPIQLNYGLPYTISIANVVNPPAGAYTLNLDYKLSCCAAVVFGCASYTINPQYSTYDVLWDSNPTYPGIALDFVPPFKACGQTDFPGLDMSGKWGNYFDLLLKPTLVGCAGPCPAGNVTVTLNLTAAPTGSNVTLSLNGTVQNLVPTTTTPQPQIVIGQFTLGANVTWNWSNAIHFDTVGDYQICVKVICPASYTCPSCSQTPTVLINKCFTIKVYQWKTAEKINLFRKWNLISLPLVPLVAGQPVADVLKAFPNYDKLIVSVHYYDCASKAWKVWGAGQTSLTTLEDGKSYWVKVAYSLSDPTKAPGSAVGGLWVWGTPKPVPPNSPSAYPVCEGWNMVGLTGYDLVGGLPTTTDGAYLWNWAGAYGAIFGWNPSTQAWWSVLPTGLNVLPQLQTGEGYWISFATSGMIYPP